MPENATQETRHINYLDGWRGAAIIFVLIPHYHLTPTIMGHGLETADLGVDFFFVLSGRLMAEILFVRESPLGLFYWRRLSRIVPALMVYIAALGVLTPFVAAIAIRPIDPIIVFTTLANYIPVSGSLGQIWSLCVEEHAYLLLSVIAFLYRRGARFNLIISLSAITVAAMLSGIAQTVLLHRGFWQVYGHSDVRISSIFVSAAAYLILLHRKLPLTGARTLLPVLAIAAGCLFEMLASVPAPVKFILGTSLLAAGLNTLEYAPPIVR